MKKICKSCGEVFEIVSSIADKRFHCSKKCATETFVKESGFAAGRNALIKYNKSRGFKPWTEHELQYLKENYKTKMNIELAKILNRTVSSVTTKFRRIGLVRGNNLRYKLQGKNMSGEKHHQFGKELSLQTKIKCSAKKQGIPVDEWTSFISFEPYDLNFNNKFKKAIRKRDNYICMSCGKHQEKEKKSLEVHHINYDKQMTLAENCCSLCRSCHGRTNGNRKHWLVFFQSLLSEKYGYKYEDNQPIIELETANEKTKRPNQ